MANATNISARQFKNGVQTTGWTALSSSNLPLYAGKVSDNENDVIEIKFDLSAPAQTISLTWYTTASINKGRPMYYHIAKSEDSSYNNATNSRAGDGTLSTTEYAFTSQTNVLSGGFSAGTYYLYIWQGPTVGSDSYIYTSIYYSTAAYPFSITYTAPTSRTLSIGSAAGITLNVRIIASNFRTSVPVQITGSSYTVYDGEKIKCSFTVATGYGGYWVALNGSQISNGSEWVTNRNNAITCGAAVLGYGLSVTKGAGCTVTVQRTSSPLKGASLTNLSPGDTIYYSDVLKISYSVSSGYRVTSFTVNGSAFTSGNSHTVVGGVSVVAVSEAYSPSTITISGNRIGSPIGITINRANSSFKHTITYQFGNVSDTIATLTTVASLSWTPPVSLCAQIPNAMSGIATIWTDTFTSDGVRVGSSQRLDFTLLLPENPVPTISSGWGVGGYTNSGTAASSLSHCVKGVSKATVAVDLSKISANYSSSLSSVVVSCGGVSETVAQSGTVVLGVFPDLSGVISLEVMDSRGLVSRASVSVVVEDYFRPYLSEISVARCDASGVAEDGGRYFMPIFSVNYVSLNGDNTVSVSVSCAEADGSYGSAEDVSSGGVYGYDCLPYGTSQETLVPEKTYLVKLDIEDEIMGGMTVQIQLSGASAAFHLKDGGLGGAFGKYALTDDLLDVAWNLRVRKDSQIDGDESVGGDLNVTGNADVGGTLNVDGATTLDDLDVGGTLTADDLSLSGNLDVAGTLDVGGDLTADQDLSVGGDIGVTGDANVGGAVGVTGGLTVGGDAEFNGTKKPRVVVASGANNGWVWIKYVDGTAEMWGRLQTGTGAWSSWGSWYVTANECTIGNYPFVFTDVPIVSFVMEGVGATMGFYCSSQGSATVPPKFKGIRPATGASTNGMVGNWYVVGRWQ